MLKYEAIDNQHEEWVVFVHGIGGSTKTWNRQIEDFSQRFNLLLLDLKFQVKRILILWHGLLHHGLCLLTLR